MTSNEQPAATETQSIQWLNKSIPCPPGPEWFYQASQPRGGIQLAGDELIVTTASGEQRAKIGDWIDRAGDGTFSVRSSEGEALQPMSLPEIELALTKAALTAKPANEAEIEFIVQWVTSHDSDADKTIPMNAPQLDEAAVKAAGRLWNEPRDLGSYADIGLQFTRKLIAAYLNALSHTPAQHPCVATVGRTQLTKCEQEREIAVGKLEAAEREVEKLREQNRAMEMVLRRVHSAQSSFNRAIAMVRDWSELNPAKDGE